MTTYKTEAEAWQCVADVLQSGEMPFYNPREDARCIGLCAIADRLFQEGHISPEVRAAMMERTNALLREPQYRERLGLDEWGIVGKRLKIAQTFAREATK